MPENYKNYKYIQNWTNDVWPYHLNQDLMHKIDKIKFKEAIIEVKKFLNEPNELNLGSGELLIKIKRVYVITRDTIHKEKIKARENFPYEITEDLFDDNNNYLYKDKIGVRNILENLKELELILRAEYQLGFESLLIDKWNNKVLKREKLISF